MKWKKALAAMLAVSLIAGCSQQEGQSEPEVTPDEETAEPAVNIARYYTELDEENHFEETHKDTLVSILSHGTAVVFLGFPECPWCQAYIPMLEEVLADNDTLCSYYNIYAYKQSDREFYDEVAELLISQNDTGEDIIQYDNDGLPVIYMPLVLFVEKGRITAFDNETATISTDLTPKKYWSSAKKEALKAKLDENVKRVAELQAKNNATGCDTGCKVGD